MIGVPKIRSSSPGPLKLVLPAAPARGCLCFYTRIHSSPARLLARLGSGRERGNAGVCRVSPRGQASCPSVRGGDNGGRQIPPTAERQRGHDGHPSSIACGPRPQDGQRTICQWIPRHRERKARLPAPVFHELEKPAPVQGEIGRGGLLVQHPQDRLQVRVCVDEGHPPHLPAGSVPVICLFVSLFSMMGLRLRGLC